MTKIENKLYLLSSEEYEHYRDLIPNCGTWWWLRDYGYDQRTAAYVDFMGNVNYYGLEVYYRHACIRPVMKLSDEAHGVGIGEEFSAHGYSWVKIDGYLAIAREPISTGRFDPFIGAYESSEVRGYLRKLEEAFEKEVERRKNDN